MPCLQKVLSVLTRGIFSLCCLLLLMHGCSSRTAQAKEPDYGTFIQLNSTNRNWSSLQWEEVFFSFQHMGFQDIVVQWSASDRDSFEPLLQQLLDMAEQHNMQVWIGLRRDSRWWQSIAMPTRFVEIYLWKLMNIQMVVADRIIRKYGLHTAFAGIYLPVEIDDSTWLTQEKLLALKGVLYQFSKRITIEHPGINIAISGFSDGIASPEQVAALWYSLITAGKLTRVYFRDCVGVRVLEPEESIRYLKAIQKRLPSTKIKIVAVLEDFTQTSEESIRSDAFVAEPAPALRLLRQVKLTQAAGLENISFSNALDYMCSAGGPEAKELGSEWKRSFQQRPVQVNLVAMPPADGLVVRPPDGEE